ncbi:MAG: hypothetical protein RRA94_04920 [Bacteroidota bacterium]|nr:hypothetical protein [Bacteroidota bacterium]
MRRITCSLLIALGLLLPDLAAAQSSETSLFGSLQTVFFNQKSHMTFGRLQPWGGTDIREERSSFAVQQFDIFLQKPIGTSFSVFVDLEYQLNYSSEQQWGSLSLQEAWLNYAPLDEINLKVGMLYPAFNNLNEIKNRLALLPYIFRPGPYERLLSDVFMSENYLPEHAFVQLHGAIPHGDVFWDYAVFVGNAEASYISHRGSDGQPENDLNRNFEFLTGVDPTEFNMKLFGGRLGIRAREESFKAGLSLTHDYDNMRDTTQFPVIYEGMRTPLAGDAPRIRIGADCSGSIGKVRFEAEFIRVVYDHAPATRLDVDLDQVFYYGMLGYGFTDRLLLYASYQGGKDVFGVEARNETVTAGAAYSISSDITGKAQYILYRNETEHGSHVDKLSIRFVFLGFSIVL